VDEEEENLDIDDVSINLPTVPDEPCARKNLDFNPKAA